MAFRLHTPKIPDINPNVNVDIEPLVNTIAPWIVLGLFAVVIIMAANLFVWWRLYNKIEEVLEKLIKKI